jgi:hypothetical protein
LFRAPAGRLSAVIESFRDELIREIAVERG